MVVAFGFLGGCTEGAERAALAARLASARATEANEAAQTQDLHQRADDLTREVAGLVTDLMAAEAAYGRAAGAFRDTADRHDHAVEVGLHALDDLREAETRYRQLASLVVAAATADLAGWQLCDGAMRTDRYRSMLRAQGVPIDGRDIDHILPHSLGGANHPWNYQPLESSLNRSLGADVLPKIASQPIALLQGLTVSALMRLQCANAPRAFGR